LVSFY